MLETMSIENRHNTFNGIICAKDFNTDYRGKNTYGGSEIASRIISDRKFDEQCRKNIEGRDQGREDYEDSEARRAEFDNLLALEDDPFGEDDDCVEEIVEPSWYILEEMRRLKLTKEEFAIRLGISYGLMNRLLSNKTKITDRIARKLERETGKSKEYWLDLQNEYDFEQDLERGMAVSV